MALASCLNARKMHPRLLRSNVAIAAGHGARLETSGALRPRENKIPLKSELLDGDKAVLRGRAVDANIVCMRIGKGETTLP
jgi:hypothetical protein